MKKVLNILTVLAVASMLSFGFADGDKSTAKKCDKAKTECSSEKAAKMEAAKAECSSKKAAKCSKSKKDK